MSLLTPPVRPDANTTSVKEDLETYRVALGKHVVAVDDFMAAGPPILLLHGIPGWRGMWRNAARYLAADCRVISPDLLGFGESSEPSGGFHASGQADMLVRLIRHLRCGPVHLVGFDFGGPIAVLVYRRAPELVSSLTLAATNVFTDTPIPVPLGLVRRGWVGDLFARVLFSRAGLAMMWFVAVTRKDAFRFAQPWRNDTPTPAPWSHSRACVISASNSTTSSTDNSAIPSTARRARLMRGSPSCGRPAKRR